ncbi:MULTISPECIES: protein translocase subunit SecD [Corallincola]|uniref:Protein translocase subunit SecD n=2 Tax=Corallincola TaxID=1775176 RepID=A0ABY1WMD5_9GAMM|nr:MULTISPECIES: protein translocase subunit SecD [Corallincola]TAA42674.1 protein translocase subunit SecD [Corallincola spongiicola]TCI01675.1 protein translocase subunit SecD [Corallincola luteus]
MLNRYPLWKYLMLMFVLGIGALYAVANLYGEDFAIQVSAQRGAEIDEQVLLDVKQTLEQNDIAYRGLSNEEGRLLVRLTKEEDQRTAQDAVTQALGAKYVVALNLASAQPEWLKGIGGNPMKLGLDLRGGVHFLMEVDMKSVVAKAEESMVADFRSLLREEKVYGASVRQVAGQGVVVRFRKAEDVERGEDLLSAKFRDLTFFEGADGMSLRTTMSEQMLKEQREYAVQQNIVILRNRVNALGVAEPLVQRQGADRIVVELPGVQDTAQAKEILGKTATLEFRKVDEKHDVRDALEGRVPAGTQLLQDRSGRPYLLEKRIILDGAHITDAGSGSDEYGRPQVNISLDSSGGGKMSKFSKDNVGKLMATVFIEYQPSGRVDKDGKQILVKTEEVINAANIQTRLGRNFRITGIDSPQEAHNLALLLRAGALIAPISIVEERTIGPSLGKQNIDAGTQAILWGFVAVVLFMLAYYRKFGIVANMALIANLVLIVAVMSLLGATLTLPGMAGIVLTVGMAVDANVLIFERIREELKEGRSPQQAIHYGYDNAFSTIADANITTFITALILMAIGSGPIQGFAVTLAVGIATSMFTAIVGTRAIVNLAWGGKKLAKLPI